MSIYLYGCVVFASYLLVDLKDDFLNRARASRNWNVIIRGICSSRQSFDVG